MNQVEKILTEALRYIESRDFSQAKKLVEKAMLIDEKDIDANHILAIIYQSEGNYDQSLSFFERTLSIQNNVPEVWYNKGLLHNEFKQYEAAIFHYERAIELNPSFANAIINLGNSCIKIGKFDNALKCYNQVINLGMADYEVWLYKGNAQYELGRYSDALFSYQQAILLQPNSAACWNDISVLLYKLGRYNEALTSSKRALSLSPISAKLWNDNGTILERLKKNNEALESYKKAFEIENSTDYVLGSIIHAKLLTSNWNQLDSDISQLIQKIRSGERAILPFSALTVLDSPELILKATKTWLAHQCLPSQNPLPLKPDLKNRKIKIAYYSADFHNHPVSILYARLFELHSREQFETYAFSFRDAPIGDAMRPRLLKAFDHFIDVKDKTDIEIANLSRDLEIDIALDLSAYTQGCRPGIFSSRAAPVQINIANPVSMGAEFIDYMIGDRILITPEIEKNSTEKIIYLPHSFQANDSERPVDFNKFKRSDFNLPESCFIYCCFNNSYKISPEVFGGWMKILKNVSNSILWLAETDAISKANLIQEAKKRNVDPSRILFAQRLNGYGDHLARLSLADLFLDTLPFNAQTTASDSLWAGVPLLTRLGKSWCGRVAASLLSAVGLDNLIVDSYEDYINLAINLGLDSEKYQLIKKRLLQNRLQKPLFDSQLFTENIEKAYVEVFNRYRNQLPPEHFYVQLID